MKPSLTRLLYLSFCLGLAGTLIGCASAKEIFEEGTELEAEGRYADAARQYIEALRKDRGLAEARTRLQEAGDRAVANYLTEADREARAGRYEPAAEAYFATDRLVDDAASVGVTLALPATYAADRRAVLDDAIEALMRRAGAAENEGQWSTADRAYQNILDRYEPSAQQAQVAERSRFRVLVRWAEADLARQQYRAAFDRAGEAIALVGGPDQRAADAAVAVQNRALEEGTLFVSILPSWRTGPAADLVPRDFIEDLDDALQLEHWSKPPLFLALADPALVRRELRRLGYRRQLLSNRQIGEVTRAADADLGVFAEIDQFSIEERDVKTRERRVETRAGVDTVFVEEKGKLRYDVRVTYTIVDERGREVYEGRVTDREEGSFERGIYAGDHNDLKLSRSQRSLFDQDTLADQEREIEERLLTSLTEKMAQSIYEHLLREVE